jgi:hypothetical protein
VVDADAIYAPSLSEPVAGFEPPLVGQDDTFYVLSLEGKNDLADAGTADEDQFYVPTVEAGAATLAPGLLDDADQFGAPTATYTAFGHVLAPGLVADIFEQVYQTSLSPDQVLRPSLMQDVDAIRSAVLARSGGTYALLPGLVLDTDRIYPAPGNARRHEIDLLGQRSNEHLLQGNDSLATTTLEGSASGRTDVAGAGREAQPLSGNDQRELELEGEY